MSLATTSANSTNDDDASVNDLQGSTAANDAQRVHFLPRGRTRANLRTARGTAQESARLYRLWRTGRLDRGSYLASIKGLAEHRSHLTAVREEHIVDDIAARLAAIEGRPTPMLSAHQPEPAH